MTIANNKMTNKLAWLQNEIEALKIASDALVFSGNLYSATSSLSFGRLWSVTATFNTGGASNLFAVAYVSHSSASKITSSGNTITWEVMKRGTPSSTECPFFILSNYPVASVSTTLIADQLQGFNGGYS